MSTTSRGAGDMQAHATRAAELHRQGRLDAAASAYREALAFAPRSAELHFNLGTALHALGRLEEAMGAYRQSLALRPDLVVAHDNLGNALAAAGRIDDAVVSYQRALALAPDHVGARYNLGVALHRAGRRDEAIAAYRAVVARARDAAPAYFNLGVALMEAGHVDDAIAAYRAAVALLPEADALANLAGALAVRGRIDEAIGALRSAVAKRPGDAMLLNNLGIVLDRAGDCAGAVESYRRALALGDAAEIRGNLGRSIARVRAPIREPALRALLVRALREAWVRPADLAAVCGGAIDLEASDATLMQDALLRTLLETTPVRTLALEQRLTAMRRVALAAAVRGDRPLGDEALVFGTTLARQCCLNEYVCACDPDEMADVGVLHRRIADAIACGASIAPAWIVAAAMYGPPERLAHVDELITRDWPAEILALLRTRIDEARAEQALRDALPQLTPIDDAISRRVQTQYEENPYPRWIGAAHVTPSTSFNAWLRRQFPLAAFASLADDRRMSMLVAGCGTGQEAVEAARAWPTAEVLAIDLSRTSLAFAARQAQALGVANVRFAQADLLHVNTLGRRFDVVSSVGVLHHLADPAAGLRALADIVEPGGFMRLGFYAERGRDDVVAARAMIAARGYALEPDDIRRCREDMKREPQRFERILARHDFYTMSECRDLLFHVQEHRMALPAIARMLAENGLRVVGLLGEPNLLQRYAERYPDDPAATDLGHWDDFEADFPDLFAGMVRLWVQKR